MSEEVSLRGTELLAIQYLMDGTNSGVSYDSFQLHNMDSASFIGDKNSDLQEVDLVKQASQSGQLCHVRFYRNYDNPVGEDYSVQVQVYNDGHIRTTKPVEPDFLDELVAHIYKVLGFRQYLIPLASQLERYVFQKHNKKLPGQISLIIEETRTAFRNVVTEYFPSSDHQKDEQDIYETLVANFGILINRTDALVKSSTPDLGTYSDFPNTDNRIRQFYNDYARAVDGRNGYNFDKLCAHLHHILNRDWDSPIETIEFFSKTYDLES